MKNKIITIILTTLSISSIFAESYLLTLEDKHYKEYIVVKEVSGSQGNVSEGYGNGVVGWNEVMRYGQEPLISDEEWQELVKNMKTGIKLVADGAHAFISADKLRNANCFSIDQALSLRTNNGQSYPSLFHNEASGCGSTGLDYDKLYMKTYQSIYNHNGYWDEVVGGHSNSNFQLYIY